MHAKLFPYRDNDTRFFDSGFFHESSSPKPLKITLGHFKFFSKILGDIRKSMCTTGTVSNTLEANLPSVSTTTVSNNWNNIRLLTLKGTMSRDFLPLVFSWISLSLAPEYPIRTVSNFFENSRRYSQVKVHHQYQQHRWQILPPVSLMLLIPVAILPPVSTIPAANCHRYQPHWRQIYHRCRLHRWQTMGTIIRLLTT